MFAKFLWIVLCLTGLTACAIAPALPSATPVAWHDQTFEYDAALVTVTKEDLFRLEPQLQAQLQDPGLQQLSTHKRLEQILALLFGRELKPFPYAQGHSTVATETWRQGRGDCLSLTVLAYAMARSLNLNAQMQEVRVPVLFDRRERTDFLNHHVNVLFRASGPVNWNESRARSQDMIVDFEPQLGTNRDGLALSDDAILARYYNNIAAEYLSRNQLPQAYAYFKAAILVQPQYAASYGNLANLYLRAGLQADAEQLLRRAVALSDEATLPLMSLHQLLLDQGRAREAAYYARLLQSRRDADPYYWIGLGLQALQDGQWRQSVAALEEAQRLTHGFEEVHRYLALAYWRSGDRLRANAQLAVLTSLEHDSSDIATLRKKFNTP
jgi:tetratricopeptide (TPR) repeat protein